MEITYTHTGTHTDAGINRLTVMNGYFPTERRRRGEKGREENRGETFFHVMGRKMERGLSFVNDSILDSFSSRAVSECIESENMNSLHVEAVDNNIAFTHLHEIRFREATPGD